MCTSRDSTVFITATLAWQAGQVPAKAHQPLLLPFFTFPQSHAALHATAIQDYATSFAQRQRASSCQMHGSQSALRETLACNANTGTARACSAALPARPLRCGLVSPKSHCMRAPPRSTRRLGARRMPQAGVPFSKESCVRRCATRRLATLDPSLENPAA